MKGRNFAGFCGIWLSLALYSMPGTQLLAQVPDLGELLKQGKQQVEQGQVPEAIATYQQASRLAPENVAVLISLGYLYARQGNYLAAIQTYQKARQLDPQNPDIPARLGFCYAALGEDNAAISAYVGAIALAPEQVSYHLALGVLLLRQGDYGRVENTYQQILALDPQNVEARVMMGAALIAQGNIARAQTFLQTAQKQFPQQPEFILQRATLEFQQNHWQKALNLVEQAQAQFPNNPKVQSSGRLLHAQIWEQQGQTGAAQRIYQQVLSTLPHSLEASLGLARLTIAQGNPRQAIALLQPLTALYPQEPDLYYTLGLAWVKNEQTDQAKPYLEKAIQGYHQRQQTAKERQAQQLLP